MEVDGGGKGPTPHLPSPSLPTSPQPMWPLPAHVAGGVGVHFLGRLMLQEPGSHILGPTD